jgi:hypothetical protein
MSDNCFLFRNHTTECLFLQARAYLMSHV